MASIGCPEVARGAAMFDTAAVSSTAAIDLAEGGAGWRPDATLSLLPGVGKATAARLAGSGLHTLHDLLSCFPQRYRELRELPTPDDASVGQLVRLRGRVRGTRANWLPGRRSMVTLELVAADGVPFEAPFFNQPWLRKAWSAGDERTVEGVLDRSGRRFVLRQARVLGADAAPCGEVQLRIHHNLLGKCSRSEVKEVYSKPQALSQCRDWLSRNMPQSRLIEVTRNCWRLLSMRNPRSSGCVTEKLKLEVNVGLKFAKMLDVTCLLLLNCRL